MDGYKFREDRIQLDVKYHIAQGLQPKSSDVGLLQKDGSCHLFEFVVEVVLTGLLCVFGFAANTVSFVVLWHDKSHSVVTFLLKALCIADIMVVWMIFIGDTIPGLSYVISMLDSCTDVCQYVNAVTKPLLFASQICTVWFTLIVGFNRYIIVCKPVHAPQLCTLEVVRREVLTAVVVAIVVTVPTTFDTILTLHKQQVNGTSMTETLAENFWYKTIYTNALQLLLIHALPLFALSFISIRLMMVLRSVKRLRRALATTYKAQYMDMTQVILMIAIMFVICYSLGLIQKILTWVHGDHSAVCGHLQYYSLSFSKMFVALNSGFKIILYCIFAQRFMHALKECFCYNPANKYTDLHVFGMYQCADMSEMTLITQSDSRHTFGVNNT